MTICIVAARAAAKSFIIAIYACCHAILYPHSKIVIASGTKNQSKLIISEKIQKELMPVSAALRREIKDIRDNDKSTEVIFYNGSSIIIVPATDNARGYRSTVLIYEEFRMIKKEIIDSVLSPTLISRPAPFRHLQEYSYLQEEPIEFYISSAWYTSHWMWPMMKKYLDDMLHKRNTYMLTLDYSITLRHGIKTITYLKKKKKEMDPVTWAMEYENRMISEKTNAYFTHSMISKNQKILKAFYPRHNVDVVSHKKNPHFIEKQKNEIRVVSCDMAFIQNKQNDNSIFSCLRLFPESKTYQTKKENALEVNKGYHISIPYLESVQGGDTEKQAIRIKQLYEDFDADYLVLDLRNAGIAIYDLLAKVLYDEERDKEYPPWKCMNDEGTANRIKVPGALSNIFVVNASQKLNSEIAIATRTAFEEGRVDLLINPDEAIDRILHKNADYINSSDTDVQVFYERPYYETAALLSEMIMLTYEVLPQTGAIRISEQGSNRKDRYTSVSYGIYFANLLGQDLVSISRHYDYVFFVN